MIHDKALFPSLPSHVYILSQTMIFKKMFHSYSAFGHEFSETTMNDRLRVFGIMTHSNFIDEMETLIRGRATTREELDDPAQSTVLIWDKFANTFNDVNFVVSHPKGYEMIDHYESMDPNDPSWFKIERDGVWYKECYEYTMKFYRLASERWYKKTGGGPGKPENWWDWRTRDDHEFQYFDRIRGPMLTWIYMSDKSASFILDAKNADLPENLQLEGKPPITPVKTTVNTKRASPVQMLETLVDKSTKSFVEMSKRMDRTFTLAFSQTESDNQQCRSRTDILNEMKNINEMINSIRQSNIDDHRAQKRMKTLDNTLDILYTQLEQANQKSSK